MENKKILEELLKECDKEKLHLCGHVQPFGGMLSVSKKSGVILHVSENISSFLHISPKNFLGTPLKTLLPLLWEIVEKFTPLSEKEKFAYKTFSHNGKSMDIKLFDAVENIVIEFENQDCEDTRSTEIMQYNIDLCHAPNCEHETSHYYQTLLKGIFEATRYDRIMLYKFHEDWSGEVLAEITKKDFGSYLGLRFPASDIPSIARELYLKNPFRHIADTLAPNIPILSLDESTPDLTYSDTRSVSPVHIEYMKNMGMQGSFSTPIIIFGELWGLIACHNATPRYLCVQQRNLCRTMAHSFSIGISSFLTNEKLQKLDSTDRYINTLLEKISGFEDVFDGIEAFQSELSSFVPCDGLTIVINENLLSIGEALDAESLEQLDIWFTNNRQENNFSTHCVMHSALNKIITSSPIAGVLATKTKTIKGNFVRCYWFRNELKQEIAWAGNPDKPVIENAGALKLSPRRSFERWIEVKSGYAKEWNRLDVVIAMKFSKTMNGWL